MFILTPRAHHPPEVGARRAAERIPQMQPQPQREASRGLDEDECLYGGSFDELSNGYTTIGNTVGVHSDNLTMYGFRHGCTTWHST